MRRKEARGGGWWWWAAVLEVGAGGVVESSSSEGGGGDGGKAWWRWMGWSVLAVRKAWVEGCSRAKSGQGAMALVGSGRARVLFAVSSTGDCRGWSRVSGRTKVHIRLE
jgi:hypothetical protein